MWAYFMENVRLLIRAGRDAIYSLQWMVNKNWRITISVQQHRCEPSSGVASVRTGARGDVAAGEPAPVHAPA